MNIFNNYVTLISLAQDLNRSPRNMRFYLKNQLADGAVKIGISWLIPIPTVISFLHWYSRNGREVNHDKIAEMIKELTVN